MRRNNIVRGCYSEHAIKVSNSYCSSASSSSVPLPAKSNPVHHLYPNNLILHNASTCIYKVHHLSSSTRSSRNLFLFIRITWSNQRFSISIADHYSSFSLSKSSPLLLLRKVKGSICFDWCNYAIELFWDLSEAIYGQGPDPISGYYVVVFVNSELSLLLGDILLEDVHDIINNGQTEELKQRISFSYNSQFLSSTTSPCYSLLISRSEHFSVSGSGSASAPFLITKAQFSHGGKFHDITINIKCKEEEEEYNTIGFGCKNHNNNSALALASVLSVFIDKKNVIRIKRLQWNFRGNQTIFVDGLLVDMMWDVHAWFFNSNSAYAFFLFRTRSGLDSRLWFEEKILEQQLNFGFSLLMICDFKTTPAARPLTN